MTRTKPQRKIISDYSVKYGCTKAVLEFQISTRDLTICRRENGITPHARVGKPTHSIEFMRECVMIYREMGMAHIRTLPLYNQLNENTIRAWNNKFPKKQLFDTTAASLPATALLLGKLNGFVFPDDAWVSYNG